MDVCVRRCFVPALLLAALAVLPAFARAETPSPPPLVHAHAHNDYQHDQPLFDALAHGFTSVEADVHLVLGELYVAHDFFGIRKDRTLRTLYLDPLRSRVRDNGGRVFPGGPQFTLLVDLKTPGEATYRALDEVLQDYRDILTSFGPAGRPGPVLVIVSGNRPRELMAAQRVRYAAYDGRLEDLDSGAPASFMPLISDKWTSVFSWRGRGAMPEAERQRLRDIVERAHREGRRVRFWATPDEPGPARAAVWSELLSAGVDLLNTDDLAGLQEFLLRHMGSAAGRPATAGSTGSPE